MFNYKQKLKFRFSFTRDDGTEKEFHVFIPISISMLPPTIYILLTWFLAIVFALFVKNVWAYIGTVIFSWFAYFQADKYYKEKTLILLNDSIGDTIDQLLTMAKEEDEV